MFTKAALNQMLVLVLGMKRKSGYYPARGKPLRACSLAVTTVEPAGKVFLCLRLHVDDSNGSTQWKMTHKSRLCVKTADNCNDSYSH